MRMRVPPLRVLIVMPLAEHRGGSEMALLHLFQFGQGLGVTWAVAFLSEGTMVQQSADMGVNTVVVPAGRLRQPRRLASAVWKIARHLRSGNFDGVLSWMGKPHLYGGPAAMLARVPALWYQHGRPADGDWLDRLATLVPARGILACSENCATGQRSLWPPRPVRVIYPGVDISRFNISDIPPTCRLRAALGLPAEGPIIGIVGRLQRWKGFHHVLEAMPSILAAHPNTTCLIVGGEHALEPDYPRQLKARISQLGLDAHVRMTGLTHEVPRMMAAMDVVIHASEEEPFGMVVIEAMALGRPVVASDQAGPREIITHGVNGLLWRHGDVESLARAVLRYLDEPCLARSVGMAARQRAGEFTSQHYAHEVVRSVVEMLSPI
jgi:glycosyltransferase involved in cell wall biosynthesis